MKDSEESEVSWLKRNIEEKETLNKWEKSKNIAESYDPSLQGKGLERNFRWRE